MILHIAVTAGDPDETMRQRALEALEAAGIEPYRAWLERTPWDRDEPDSDA